MTVNWALKINHWILVAVKDIIWVFYFSIARNWKKISAIKALKDAPIVQTNPCFYYFLWYKIVKKASNSPIKPELLGFHVHLGALQQCRRTSKEWSALVVNILAEIYWSKSQKTKSFFIMLTYLSFAYVLLSPFYFCYYLFHFLWYTIIDDHNFTLA